MWVETSYPGAGGAGVVNTGAGGNVNSTAPRGSGGGSGDYCETILTTPLSSSYQYQIGTRGNCDLFGSSGAAGGRGGDGLASFTGY